MSLCFRATVLNFPGQQFYVFDCTLSILLPLWICFHTVFIWSLIFIFSGKLLWNDLRLRQQLFSLHYDLLSCSAASNVWREHQLNSSRWFCEAHVNSQWSKDENLVWCFILLLLPVLLRVISQMLVLARSSSNKVTASNTLYSSRRGCFAIDRSDAWEQTKWLQLDAISK